MTEEKGTAISAIINPDDYAAMSRWCKENERSVAWFIRRSIAMHLDSVGYKDAE